MEINTFRLAKLQAESKRTVYDIQERPSSWSLMYAAQTLCSWWHYFKPHRITSVTTALLHVHIFDGSLIRTRATIAIRGIEAVARLSVTVIFDKKPLPTAFSQNRLKMPCLDFMVIDDSKPTSQGVSLHGHTFLPRYVQNYYTYNSLIQVTDTAYPVVMHMCKFWGGGAPNHRLFARASN